MMKKSNRFWRWFWMLVAALLFIVGWWFDMLTMTGDMQAFVLIGGFIDGLRPEPVLTVTEWSEKYRILNTKGSAEAGPYRVGRTPYLRKIMDCASARSRYKRIIFMKGSQIGASEAGFNIIAYYMDMVPCPIFYLMPTVETMERKTKQTIDPMIEDCPRLKAKVGKKRSKDGGNTLGQKDGPGFTLFLGGANSAASLASVPVRVVVADEVDRYPGDVDGEGSPVSLIETRQSTFGDTKVLYMPSTPVEEDTSVVYAEYNQTDQHEYMVPCPHCMGLQVLVFKQVKWVAAKMPADRDVHYECIHCHKKIYNHHKTFMLVEDKSQYIPGHADEGRARWVASHPELSRPDVIGFGMLGALYSPEGWYSWEELVDDWIKAENDEPKKKAFVNTKLGLPYKTKGIAPPWQKLHERAQLEGWERNVVTESVVFITAGADVQGDRIEVQIRGWMKGRMSQMIDYRVLLGDTTKPEVWADMDKILEEEWLIESGSGERRVLKIKLLAIDANFNSDHVHNFARKWGTKRVIPIQGRETLQMPFSNPKAITKTKTGKNLPKGKVWPVGSSYLKELIYGWLRLEIGEDGVIPKGFCHFLPMDEHFFRGLTAEERVPVRNKRTNAIKYEWVKRYERNEPLDTMVYLTAAAFVLGFDRWNDARWDKEGGNVAMRQYGNVKNVVERVPEAPKEPEKPRNGGEERAPGKKKRRGGFWKDR